MQRPALAMLLATSLVTACGGPPPELVWIPAAGYGAALEIAVDPPAGEAYKVGEWIVLHATRSTGPWKQVAHKDLPEGAGWMREPPPAREEAVEANVRWYADPPGQHEFNLPEPKEIMTRTVRFSSAGVFQLWAESHTWGGEQVRSNIVELAIRD
jgi:hypothetical protein